jgi:hypothetical protein
MQWNYEKHNLSRITKVNILYFGNYIIKLIIIINELRLYEVDSNDELGDGFIGYETQLDELGDGFIGYEHN